MYADQLQIERVGVLVEEAVKEAPGRIHNKYGKRVWRILCNKGHFSLKLFNKFRRI